MKRIVVSLPEPLKAKLDALRGQGYSVAGYVRAVLERELSKTNTEPKAR